MAAVTVATLTARLEAQTRDFQTQIANAEKRLNSIETASGRAGSGIQKMSGLMRGAAAAGIGVMAVELFKLGVQAEAWSRKTDTVFGRSADDIRAWSDTMNERLGVSEERLAGMAATVGDLLVPMGFARDKSAAMSKEILTLSGALSEWSGGTRSAQEAQEIITRAILGEREALISLGVKISEEDVKQRLLKNGMDKLTGAALAQAKAQATLELITERSTDAMSSFADGGSEAMRSQNELKAAVDALKVGIGQLITEAAPLISLFAGIVGVVVDLFDGIDKLNAVVAEMSEAEMAAAVSHDEFVSALDEAALALQSGITGDVFRLEERLRGVDEAASDAEDGIRGLMSAMLEQANPALAAIKANERLAETLREIDADGQRTTEEWLDYMEAVGEADAAQAAFSADGIEAEIEAVAKMMGIGREAAILFMQQAGLLDGMHVRTTFDIVVNGQFPVIPPELRGRMAVGNRAGITDEQAGVFGGSLGRHSGGLIPGPSGRAVPILAMAGERVVPAGISSGGGGGSVNVYVAGTVVSERDLVDAVRRGLRQDRIRGGSLEF